MRIGSLFSGIGGLDLGLERAGVGRVVWQVERDPFCQEVLRRHWPDAVVYDDVTEVRGERRVQGRIASGGDLAAGCVRVVEAGGLDLVRNDCLCERGQSGCSGRCRRSGADRLGILSPVDVICGGFPCTDVSASATARIRGRTGLDGAASGLWREYARIVGEVLPTFVVVENVNSGQADWLPDVRRDLWGLGYASVPLRVRALDVGAPHLRSRIFVVAYPERAGRSRDVLSEVARAAEAAVDAARRDRPDTWRVGVAHLAPRSVLRGGGDGVQSRLDRRRTRALGNAVVPQVGEVIGAVVVALAAALAPLALPR